MGRSLLKFYLRLASWVVKKNDPLTSAVLGAALDAMKRGSAEASSEQEVADVEASVHRRARLAAMILPEVVERAENGNLQSAPKVARDWALACSDVVGILCAMSVKPKNQVRAIEEVARNTARVTKGMRIALTGIANYNLPQDSPSAKAPSEPHPTSPEAKSEPRTVSEAASVPAMMNDLRQQARRVDDPGMKAALLAAEARLRATKGDLGDLS